MLGITAVGLYNVYSDNTELQARAARLACGGVDCPTEKTRLERTPFSQTFEFHVATKATGGAGATVAIVCRPAYLLVGDYDCRTQ